MTDLKALRELCDAATDGEWRAKALEVHAGNEVIALVMMDSFPLTVVAPNEVQAKRNTAFIAATDPQTVRALIDEIEKLRSEVDRWRLEVEALEIERREAERN